MFVSRVVSAQAPKSEKDLVMYDPLFWKDQLSLKNAQSRKIEQINQEFYDGLRQLKQESHSREQMRVELDQGLQARSVKIWSTLDNRQKRKLERILETSALQGP